MTASFGRVRFRSSTSGGCLQMAAANIILETDEEAAVKISKLDHKFYGFGAFAREVRRNLCTWTVEDTFRRISSQKTIRNEERLDWILKQKEGLYLIHPITLSGGDSHIVSVDCHKKIIYDPLTEYPLRLSKEALGLCCGESPSSRCFGIRQVRSMRKMRSQAVLRKRRKKKTRRGRKSPRIDGC